jgi:uncharacterized protein
MLIGTLAEVRRYPAKSLRGEALDRVAVEASGISGDRSTALFATSGPRASKTYRGKENDRLHLISEADEARGCAAQRGVGVELRHALHFFDDAPISIVVDAWLEGLDAHVGYAVQWERFRPNFFVRANGAAPSEQRLTGEVLQLGTVRLRVRCPIERCVTITYHPEGEASDPRILRYLAQERDAFLGIYCDVLEPGVVRAGDALIAQRTE